MIRDALCTDRRSGLSVLLILLLIPFLHIEGCSSAHKTEQPEAPLHVQLDNIQVAQRVQKLRGWPTVSCEGFSQLDWQHYIDLAREMQRTDPGTIESGLLKFEQNAYLTLYPFHELSKAYILLRVMFDIPEHFSAEVEQIRDQSNAGRMTPEIVFPEESPFDWTESTPVAWTAGGPVLTARLSNEQISGSGAPYIPAEEYRFFGEHFKFRKLPIRVRFK